MSQTSGTVNGITNIEYQIPALDRAGNVLLDSNGVPVYKGQTFTKTVYDPSVISDSKIVQLGQEAAAKGYSSAIANGMRAYNADAGGIQFRIYLDLKTGLVINFHPQ